MKRILVLEGLRGLGWVHEDRLTKDVAHWERAFDLLAGLGTDEVQREGCGQRVGDNLRLTVVTDENRSPTLSPSSGIVILNWPGRIKTQPHDDRDNCFLHFDSKGPCGMTVNIDIDDDSAAEHGDSHRDRASHRLGVSAHDGINQELSRQAGTGLSHASL